MSDIKEVVKNVKTIVELAKVVTNLIDVVTKLSDKVEELKTELNEVKERKVAGKNIVKERNIENRKYDEKMIRYIFYLNEVRNLSGYKISKLIDENAPFVYNILNRKIYSDVNVSSLTSDDNLMLG